MLAFPNFNIYLAVILHIGLFSKATSQSLLPPPSIERSPLEIMFKQNNQTFEWSGIISRQFEVGKNMSISFNENFSSKMIERRKGNKWRDDHNFKGSLGRQFSKNISGEVQLTSSIISDKQTGLFNDKSSYTFRLSSKYQPNDNTQYKPIIGYKNEHFQNTSEGVIYGFETSLKNVQWQGYNNHLKLHVLNEDLDERKNNNFSFRATSQKEFAPNTGDSLSIIIKRQQFGYFTQIFNSDGPQNGSSEIGLPTQLFLTIRQEKNQGIQNTFYYPLNSKTNIGIFTSIQNTDIDIKDIRNDNNQSTENQIFGNNIWMNYSNDRLDVSATFSIQQKTQQFLAGNRSKQTGFPFRRSDYEENNRKLSVKVGSRLTKKDHVNFSTVFSLLKYNTPENNNDDKDVFRSRFVITGKHTFNSNLILGTKISADISHLVFLFSERSADNRWSRIFQLAPEIYFQPSKNFRTFNRFEILANYTVYDFETLSQIRSIVFRQFVFSDSSLVKIMPNLTTNIKYKWKQSDVGLLDWDNWIQDVTTERNEMLGHFSIAYSSNKNMQFGPGVNFYYRTEKRDKLVGNQETRIQTKLTHIAPLFNLTYHMNNGFILKFSGEHRLIDTGDKKYTLNNVNINLSWVFI